MSSNDQEPRDAAPKRFQKPAATPKPVKEDANAPAVCNHPHLFYSPTCRACIAADRERLKQPQDIDFNTTLFLYAQGEPDDRCIPAWLLKRYPDIQHYGSQMPLFKIAAAGELSIVVVRRQASPGIAKTSHFKRVLQDDNKWTEVRVPDEELFGQIVESGPIHVSEHVDLSGVSLMSPGQVDPARLVRHIAELVTGHRVIVPSEDQKLKQMGEHQNISDDPFYFVSR